MGFRPPAFPLTANIWHSGGVGGAYASPDLVLSANLSPGRRVLTVPAVISSPGISPWFMELLVPMRSDVRASWNGGVSDLVEVPAGSGRFYVVYAVDDVGRGFLNEYRIVLMNYQPNGTAVFGAGLHPAPVPLP